MADLKPCGTLAARDRHRYHGEEVCPACTEAWNAYRRGLRGRTPALRPAPRCGTVSGYVRHRQRKDPDCVECREAWNVYQRAYRARKREVPDGGAA